MKNLLVILLVTIVMGCSGTPVKEVEVEAPVHKVLDAAPGGQEAWLDNPNLYAEKNGLNTSEFLYFTGDAQSADKRMACEKAHADTVDDIAKEVVVFVDSAIARAASDSTSADTDGNVMSSTSSTETSKISSQLTKTAVGGISKIKQYWEQRDYSANGGAKSIYYCWILSKVSKKDVQAMVSKARMMRLNSDLDTKKKVEGKLQTLGNDFEKFIQTR